MWKHRQSVGPVEGTDFERTHLRGKAAHRRRRRKKLEEKSRWRQAAWEGVYA